MGRLGEMARGRPRADVTHRPREVRGGVTDWLLDPVPARRLAVLRILVVGYAVGWLTLRLPHLLSVARLRDDARFDPVGPLSLLPRPVPPALAMTLVLATLAVGIAALVGWHWRVMAPVFAVGFLFVTTYRNSWGQVFH